MLATDVWCLWLWGVGQGYPWPVPGVIFHILSCGSSLFIVFPHPLTTSLTNNVTLSMKNHQDPKVRSSIIHPSTLKLTFILFKSSSFVNIEDKSIIMLKDQRNVKSQKSASFLKWNRRDLIPFYLTTLVPTILANIIGHTTNYFADCFEASIGVNLTLMLVLTTM